MALLIEVIGYCHGLQDIESILKTDFSVQFDKMLIWLPAYDSFTHKSLVQPGRDGLILSACCLSPMFRNLKSAI